MIEINVPDLVDEAKVICYAIVNLMPFRKVDYKPASFAAICQYKPNDGYYLFYCDNEWKVFADTWHETLEDAKDQAEYDYQDIADKWNYK